MTVTRAARLLSGRVVTPSGRDFSGLRRVGTRHELEKLKKLGGVLIYSPQRSIPNGPSFLFSLSLSLSPRRDSGRGEICEWSRTKCGTCCSSDELGKHRVRIFIREQSIISDRRRCELINIEFLACVLVVFVFACLKKHEASLFIINFE